MTKTRDREHSWKFVAATTSLHLKREDETAARVYHLVPRGQEGRIEERQRHAPVHGYRPPGAFEEPVTEKTRHGRRHVDLIAQGGLAVEVKPGKAHFLVIGGERGRRRLYSLDPGDALFMVKVNAARMFEDCKNFHSLWADTHDRVLHFYVVVQSWHFDDLQPVYAQERRLMEEYEELEMDFTVLLEDEQDWIPDSAERVLRR